MGTSKSKAAKPETIQQQMALEVGEPAAKKPGRKSDTPIPWPKELPEQVKAVAEVLSAASNPLSMDDIATRFTGRGPWKKRLPQILETLVTMGRARRLGSRFQSA